MEVRTMSITPQSVMDGMAKKNRLLSVKNDELAELTEKKAAAERDYNIAYAKEVMNLKLEGEKITLIPSIAKGNKMVAEFKYKADIADGVYVACREKIKDSRVQVDSYRSLLTWMRAELTGQSS